VRVDRVICAICRRERRHGGSSPSGACDSPREPPEGDLRRRPVRRGRGGGVRTRRWTRAADAVDEASGIDQAPVTLRDAGR